MSALSIKNHSYSPEAVWSARRAFFSGSSEVSGPVDQGVLRSWARCLESGRDAGEPVEFQAVDRPRLSQLLEANAALLTAARAELPELAASVSDAGYAVLLTDRLGNALAVDGAIGQRSNLLRAAFRRGVDLSEAAIGTTAMAVAIREGRAARVLGPEHFYTDAQIFHCSAAPVFDAQGCVVGAIDVSRDMPGLVDSAVWLAARCALRVERRLFVQIPAALCIEIDVSGGVSGFPSHGSSAWLSFGSCGELVAASRAARELIGLEPGQLGIGFEQLFEERFGIWQSNLRRMPSGAPLRLQSGVRLRAVSLDIAPPDERAAKAPPKLLARENASPMFGDARLERGFERALRAYSAGLPVLISGETGTGKEVVAHALHQCGDRAGKPFIALNCAAVPGELLAAELFGHVDGAFTGSRRGGAEGKIEAANGGTLFLDEIGDMPLPLQAAMLRVLDQQEVTRLGSTRTCAVDVHIVCATHRSLPDLVAQGSFREDLLYRVNGHSFHLIPLRDRENFDAVLDVLLAKAGVGADRVSSDLRAQLRSQRWNGNVRQLAHAVRRALALATPAAELSFDDFELERFCGEEASPPTGLLQRATGDAIVQALQLSGGNVAAAAKLLGIGRATLYRRIKNH